MQSTLPVDVLDLVPSKFWFEPPMSESNDSETLLRVAFQNRCKVFWHCKEMNTITREPISDSSVTNSKKRRQKPKNYRFTVQAPTLTTTLNTNFGATKSLSWSMLNHPGKKVPKSSAHQKTVSRWTESTFGTKSWIYQVKDTFVEKCIKEKIKQIVRQHAHLYILDTSPVSLLQRLVTTSGAPFM